MELTKVLLLNYLPYAKGTIIGRAIPSIDGLKPSQRRILYTMYKMGLLKGNKTKSSNIVGQTMHLHPHGDATIYDSLVRMTTGNESLNVPYIESKGNFGKVFSKSLAYAASRYTEAKLAPICEAIFDGIDEDAVDFIDNFDSTTKEPTLLPVKFPTILVNTSSGIAVGKSSNIPSFALKNVCDATIGVIDNKVKDAKSLMAILGAPEFTTGGYIHTTDADLEKLAITGKQTFTLSGSVTTYSNRIEITEIPYETTAESIISDIEKYAKSGELKEVSNVSDEIDLSGFKIVVELKRGSNSKSVLAKICRYTNLVMQANYSTVVIIGNKCEDIGILDLLKTWVEFRLETLDRIYNYRIGKHREKEHLLETWERIKLNILDVVDTIAKREDEEAKKELMKNYKLDDEQAEYLLDMKLRTISQDNLRKKLKQLDDVRKEIKECTKVIDSRDEKCKIIKGELESIRDKYGSDKKTVMAEPIKVNLHEKEEIIIDDSKVVVVLTKSGYIKRLITEKDSDRFEVPEGDEVQKRWFIKNNSQLLVFTYSGEVYKILVDDIDASRGGVKEKVIDKVKIPDENDIAYVDAAGDYTGHINIVYWNGRGVRIRYNKFSGNRGKYKAGYEGVGKGKIYFTKEDKFFMVTAKKKAAFCDLTNLGTMSNREAYKVARVPAGDKIIGLQSVKYVPDMSKIDTERYTKGYCVSIRNDQLW